MTKMRKTRVLTLVRMGGAKALTNGSIVGSPELDLVSLFRQA